MSLRNIKVVLVEPSHPGNIGAAARAMKAMGLSRLALVKPRVFPHADATARAAGADDLLARAEQHETLGQALRDCRMAIATSARRRHLSWPVLEPRELGAVVLSEASTGEVALVFGRENNGLSNEELDLCNRLVHIPTEPGFSSLNVAASVQIIAYEIFSAARVRNEPVAEAGDYPSHGEVENFFAHLQEVLCQIGFLDRRYPRRLMRRLRLLFHRIRVDRREINILRGILTAVGSHVVPVAAQEEEPDKVKSVRFEEDVRDGSGRGERQNQS